MRIDFVENLHGFLCIAQPAESSFHVSKNQQGQLIVASIVREFVDVDDRFISSGIVAAPIEQVDTQSQRTNF